MASLLIRELDSEILALLNTRADHNGRSLEEEAKVLLVEAAQRVTRADALAVFEKWRHRWADRVFSDSAKLIREDRERLASGQRD